MTTNYGYPKIPVKKARSYAFSGIHLFWLLHFLFFSGALALILLLPTNALAASSASLPGSTAITTAMIPGDQSAEDSTLNDQAEELQLAINKMAHQLVANLTDPDPELGLLAEGVTVSTFVDLKKLTRTSSFGRYLAEQLMTDFQQQGYTIIEVRKTSSILIQERHGEYGLSRNADQINNSITAGSMITGTYLLAGDHIMVNAKVLDNEKATLLSSATMLFPRNQLADLLIADRASASSTKKTVTYMKRLEL